jgi:hypothetical protein
MVATGRNRLHVGAFRTLVEKPTSFPVCNIGACKSKHPKLSNHLTSPLKIVFEDNSCAIRYSRKVQAQATVPDGVFWVNPAPRNVGSKLVYILFVRTAYETLTIEKNLWFVIVNKQIMPEQYSSFSIGIGNILNCHTFCLDNQHETDYVGRSADFTMLYLLIR